MKEKTLINAIATAKRKASSKYCKKNYLYMDAVSSQYKRYNTIKGVDEM